MNNEETNVHSNGCAEVKPQINEVHLTADKEYSVLIDGNLIGKLVLDYHEQVEKVLFYSAIPSYLRLVKELALSHATQFVIKRKIMSSEILALVPSRELDEYDCANLMSFDKIPDSIKNLDDAKLDNYLAELATVLEGRFTDLAIMLCSLFSEIREGCGVAVGLKEAKRSHGDGVILTFVCDPKHSFRIWKSLNDATTSPEHRLHITPPYHPVLAGKEEFCLINGDTNYYIRGGESGIITVLAPEEAVLQKSFFGSWSNLNHPFYAQGRSLVIEICPTLCLTEGGYQTLLGFLRAALNQGDNFVAVSGGFRSPYEYVGNILNRKGIVSPAGRHGAYDYRGSEADCVWEYQILETENQLTGALLPSWFLREGWLKIYQDEKPKGTENNVED